MAYSIKLKTAFTFAVLFILFLQSTAQKGLPAFGKVDKADLELTDCDFDKGASAMVLIDYGSTYYDRGTQGISLFKTFFERRIRIKILKEKGISQADIEIPYYTRNNEEQILKLRANTYNLDGSGKVIVTEVKRSSIYSKKIDGEFSKMIIVFPEVKVGSIIEYSYTLERETMGNLRNWYFQRSIPVRYSEYQLRIPKIFIFSVQSLTAKPIEEKQEVLDDLVTSSVGIIETQSQKSNYVMRNIEGLKEEPFMGSPRDYLQRLEFNLTQINYGDHVEDRSLKWSNVISNLMKDEDFGMQLQSKVNADDFLNEANRISDPESRMKFIFERLRKAINWNEDYDIYTANGIRKTWETKAGNSADINLLLVNLLNESQLKAAPVLVSTRNHGLVVPLAPVISQFNTVMAYIVINNKTFILDATDKIINYKMVPEPVVNTRGLVLQGENGSWKDFLSGKYKYKVMAAVQGVIDADGVMKGNGLVNCYDYARVQRCESWTTNKEKFKNDYFITPYTSLKFEDFTVNNADADSLPLEQKVIFNSTLNSSGNYRYFSVNLFSDLETNPFIADKRVSDIDFGVTQEYIIFGNYTIPQDYVFDGLPQNISMTTPANDILFTRTSNADGNLLNVRMTIEFKRSFYAAATYPDFREFYKKLIDKLNEQVVIKKKSSP